jgi:hypothetical protein
VHRQGEREEEGGCSQSVGRSSPKPEAVGTSRQNDQALTSRMGHMASAVVPPSRVQNL